MLDVTMAHNVDVEHDARHFLLFAMRSTSVNRVVWRRVARGSALSVAKVGGCHGCDSGIREPCGAMPIGPLARGASDFVALTSRVGDPVPEPDRSHPIQGADSGDTARTTPWLQTLYDESPYRSLRLRCRCGSARLARRGCSRV